MTDSVPTDAALLAAARIGERAAIEALLERYQARVFRFGLHMSTMSTGASPVGPGVIL